MEYDDKGNKINPAGKKGMYDSVVSTGKTGRTFSTGSVRDNAEGKGRPDLIPPYPLKRLSVHFENGAKKYGDRNWEKGQPVNELYNSAFRHLTDWLSGDNSEDHLSAAVWNLFAMVHTIKEVEESRLPAELVNDLPDPIRLRSLNARIDYNRKNFKFAGQQRETMETHEIVSDVPDKIARRVGDE